MEAINWFFENITIIISIIVVIGFMAIFPYLRMIDIVLRLIKYKSLKTVFRMIKEEHEDYQIHKSGISLFDDILSAICNLSVAICFIIKIRHNPIEGLGLLAVCIILVVWLVIVTNN